MRLAFDPKGCREVQRLLAEASQEFATALALELKGHVREAVESPHANHVVQRIVECLPATVCSFVPEELVGFGEAVARHRYGCRVLCRLAEADHHAERSAASAALLQEVILSTENLCRNEFGKHVLNSILEHSTDEHRSQVVLAICPKLLSHATHRAASYVVERTLEHARRADQEMLVEMLLSAPEGLVTLAKSQAGCHVIRGMMKYTRWCRPRIEELLWEAAPQLGNAKYGKLLLQEMGMTATTLSAA